jgi:hypothetical protein
MNIENETKFEIFNVKIKEYLQEIENKKEHMKLQIELNCCEGIIQEKVKITPIRTIIL